MKRILIFTVTALFVCGVTTAAPVSQSKARSIADKVLKVDRNKVAVNSVSLSYSTGVSGESPAYYIFNYPQGGFVIVAADDVATPVLAYSDKGSFSTDNLPENIQYWCDGVATEIREAVRSGAEASEEVKNAWTKYENGGDYGTSVIELQTAQWGQGDPFNRECPTLPWESSKSVTGCVATAMGIIIRYHQYPTQGKGTLESYDIVKSEKEPSTKYTVSGYSLDDHQYDYTKMPTDNPKAWSDDEKDEVAKLLHDCGVMVQMEYSSKGSGAATSNAADALIDHMSYSKGSGCYFRDCYTSKQWIELLKNELNTQRPILFSGRDKSNKDKEVGHAFVLDGFDTGNLFHVNWGWSGSDNGYFSIDALCAQGYTFNSSQMAVLGLKPDPTGTDSELTNFSLEGNGKNYFGISLDEGTIKKDSYFKMKIGYIINLGGDIASTPVYVRLAHLSARGEFKEFINASTLGIKNKEKYDGIAWYNIYCIISKDIEPGDYISLFFSKKDSDKFSDHTIMPFSHTDYTVGRYLLTDTYFIDSDDITYLEQSIPDTQSFTYTEEGGNITTTTTYTNGRVETIVLEEKD